MTAQSETTAALDLERLRDEVQEVVRAYGDARADVLTGTAALPIRTACEVADHVHALYADALASLRRERDEAATLLRAARTALDTGEHLYPVWVQRTDALLDAIHPTREATPTPESR